MKHSILVSTIALTKLETNLAVMESTLINMLDSHAINTEVADQLNFLNRASILTVERILRDSK